MAKGKHKDTVCLICCRTAALRKTTHRSRLGLRKQAVPAVTGRAVTTPGHISTGFIVQLFCPESACAEQSRAGRKQQDRAVPVSPGSSCLGIFHTGSQNTKGEIKLLPSAGRTKLFFFLQQFRSPEFCPAAVFSRRVKHLFFFPSCSLLHLGVLCTCLWKPCGNWF